MGSYHGFSHSISGPSAASTIFLRAATARRNARSVISMTTTTKRNNNTIVMITRRKSIMKTKVTRAIDIDTDIGEQIGDAMIM